MLLEFAPKIIDKMISGQIVSLGLSPNAVTSGRIWFGVDPGVYLCLKYNYFYPVQQVFFFK